MIKLIQDDSVQSFLKEAGPLLYKNEPTNSLMLGVCEGMLTTQPNMPPLFLRITQNDVTLSAAVQTPPLNLILTYADHDVLRLLAEYLNKSQFSFPGVVGPAGECDFFANEWTKLAGKKCQLGMGQKIYKLEKVVLPNGVPGSMREAKPEEEKTAFDWVLAFANESLPAKEKGEQSRWRDFAATAIQKKAAHFWIHDNKPVSIAFANRPTRDGVSISMVYTPPEFRKKGFASAVVAQLSQKMLDSGKKFCVLYTDLANPTSNKIYQDIGYQEVTDSKLILFE